MASSVQPVLEHAFGLLSRRDINQSDDDNIGSSVNSDTNSNSASSILSTLAPVAIVAAVWAVLFLVLRRKFPRKYNPRTYLRTLLPSERSPALPTGLFNWFGAFVSVPDTNLLKHSSLDGFLFLRFLKISVVICLVGAVICIPVLLPVNITGGGGQEQLDILSMSNVSNNYYRYLAHAGCAYLFFGFIIFMITRECIFYINLRQAFLMSPIYSTRMSSRTVLFTSVPEYYLDEGRLRGMLGKSVQRIWIPTDTSELDDLVSERDKVSLQLEGAETKLCKLAHNAKIAAEKKGASPASDEAVITEDGGESGSVAARWIRPKDRPTHRLKFLIGKKVDTINWARDELQKLIPQVREEQEKHRGLSTKKLNAVFVEFDSVSDAQAAYQSLTHHQILHMAPRYTGLNPEEVIWSNLRIKWWERLMRLFATTAFVVALVVFWSIPVAFVGVVSQINYLTEKLPWLGFINDLPKPVLGVVTGLLPVIMLAVLMSLLPVILRLMAKLGGDPTLSAVELTVQNSYFGFQVVQVFLVATLSSAASSAIQDVLKNPQQITSMLAKSIPKASNFYLSYFILQGLGVVSGIMVGLAGLVISIILSKILDTTPRKMYKRWTALAGLGWGTVFPIYTNLLVIAICYACIAPIILIFASIGLSLFYFAYRYNLLFVYDVNVDTKGLVYPRALQQLFVGLYIAELCLVGLFAIKSGSSGGALGAMILMIAFIIFTALYNISLNNALGPLLRYLPKSLEAEERALLASEKGETNGEGPSTGEKPFTSEREVPNTPKPGMLAKFLKPHIYCDYATLRESVPRDFANIEYEPEVERDAYLHPSIKAEPMTLWIPRDCAGVSIQEVRDTRRIIPITDESAYFDEKGKLIWDADQDGVAPIHEPKVFY